MIQKIPTLVTKEAIAPFMFMIKTKYYFRISKVGLFKFANGFMITLWYSALESGSVWSNL